MYVTGAELRKCYGKVLQNNKKPAAKDSNMKMVKQYLN
jgi:hypothetical protein